MIQFSDYIYKSNIIETFLTIQTSPKGPKFFELKLNIERVIKNQKKGGDGRE